MATPPKSSPSPSPLLISTAEHSLILHPVSIAIILFAMTPLILVMLWMALTLHLPSFQVTSVTVTSLATTPSAQLTASFQVNGILGNTNILHSILYESLDLVLWFDHHTISSAPVKPLPFSTGAATDTPVEARFEVSRKLFPIGVVKGIAEQRGRGLADFGVTLHGRVRFMWGGVTSYSRVRALKVECNPLHVVFFPCNNNGTGRLVAPHDCSPV